MTQIITAIFDGEVFRPETPVNLEPNARYSITTKLISNNADLDEGYQFAPNLVDALEAPATENGQIKNGAKSATTLKPATKLSLTITYVATFDGQNFRPNNPTSFEQNARYWLSYDATIITDSHSDAFDVLMELAGTYDGPEDWSAETDHYLYGSPKQGEHLKDER